MEAGDDGAGGPAALLPGLRQLAGQPGARAAAGRRTRAPHAARPPGRGRRGGRAQRLPAPAARPPGPHAERPRAAYRLRWSRAERLASAAARRGLPALHALVPGRLRQVPPAGRARARTLRSRSTQAAARPPDHRRSDMAVESSASASWQGDLMAGSGNVQVASGAFPEQTLTWRARAESRESGTSPEELIAAAHAGC